MKKVQFWVALSVLVMLSQNTASLAESKMPAGQSGMPQHMSQPKPDAEKLSAESRKGVNRERPLGKTREERIEERREENRPNYKRKEHKQTEIKKSPGNAPQEQKKR
jgi:hypothetical protein